MPASLFFDWRYYEELEPFGIERIFYGFANVVQTLWNIARNKERHPEPLPLDNFLLRMGDMPRLEPVKQSLEEQERRIDSWIFVSNEVFKSKQKVEHVR